VGRAARLPKNHRGSSRRHSDLWPSYTQRKAQAWLITKIYQLSEVSAEIVEAARENLVGGQA